MKYTIIIMVTLMMFGCDNRQGIEVSEVVTHYNLSYEGFDKAKVSNIRIWLGEVKEGDEVDKLWDLLGYRIEGHCVIIDKFYRKDEYSCLEVVDNKVLAKKFGHNGICVK